jgi:hypothetical protein
VSTFLYELPFGRNRHFGGDKIPARLRHAGRRVGRDRRSRCCSRAPFSRSRAHNAIRRGTGSTVRGFTATQRSGRIRQPTARSATRASIAYFDKAAFVSPPKHRASFGNAGSGPSWARARKRLLDDAG